MKFNKRLVGILSAAIIGSTQLAHANNPPGARDSWESGNKVDTMSGFFDAWDDDGSVTNILIYGAPDGFSQSSYGDMGWSYEPRGMATNHSIAFQAIDDYGAKSATNYLNLNLFNRFPRAIAQSVESQEGEDTYIFAEGTDDDGDSLSYTLVDSVRPEHGTVNRVGPIFFYRADTNYFGPDRFQFRAYDGEDSGEAYVEVEVLRTDRPFGPLSLTRTGTNSTLTAKLQPNRTYVLEESPDLTTWTGTTTNEFPFSTLDFTNVVYNFSDTNTANNYRIRRE